MSQNVTVQKVMEKINQEHLHPVSRWQFVLRYALLWALGIMTVVSGAVVIALIVFDVQNGELAEYRLLHLSPMGAFLQAIPFVWIFFLAVFLVVAHLAVRHTRHGYRFGVWSILGMNILCSICLGSVLYAVGVARHMDRAMGHFVPGYIIVEQKREGRWMHPEEGRIFGLVQSDPQENTFILRDRYGRNWTVVVVSDDAWSDTDVMHIGSMVGAIGKSISEKEFHAVHLRVFPDFDDMKEKYRARVE